MVKKISNTSKASNGKTKANKTSKEKSLLNQIKTGLDKIKKDKKLITKIPNNIWKIGGLLSLAFLVLYISTIANAPVSYSNGDEFLAVAYDLGLSRPPGQPLYIMLLHFFINLSIPGSVAFRGHLLSAILQSLSLLLVFVSTWVIIKHIQLGNKKPIEIFSKNNDSLFIAGIAILGLGSSFLFWQYSIVTEKFGFNCLLISLIIFQGLKFLFIKNQKSNLPLLAGLFGLVVGNYPAAIFLLPMVLFLIFLELKKGDKKYLIKTLIYFLGGIIINILLIIWLGSRNTTPSWYFEKNIEGFINYFTANDFSQNTLLGNFGNNFSRVIPVWINNFYRNFGLIILIFSILGIKFILNISKKIAGFLILGSGFLTLLFPLLLSWSNEQFVQALIQRHYLAGFLFVPFLFSIGLYIVLFRLKKGFLILSKKENYFKIGTLLIIFTFFLLKFLNNYSQLNLKNFIFSQDFYRDALTKVPKNSILTCFSQIDCGGLLYQKYVDNVRKDVIIIPSSYPLLQQELEDNLNLRGFDYQKNPMLTFDYLTWNIGKKPVYVMGFTKAYHDILGMNHGFTYYIPHGYVGELVRQMPDEFSSQDLSFANQLKQMKVSNKNLNELIIREKIGNSHFFNGFIYEKSGHRDKARDEINMMSDMFHQIPSFSRKKIESLRLEVESMTTIENWKLGSPAQSTDEIMVNIDIFLEYNKHLNAYHGALGMVTIDPLNRQGRIKLAQIYELFEQYDKAKVEYQNVLKYYPNDAQALEELSKLDNI
jgi:transmembrane protein TMEM260 (protein O-mannosyltransferase)